MWCNVEAYLQSLGPRAWPWGPSWQWDHAACRWRRIQSNYLIVIYFISKNWFIFRKRKSARDESSDGDRAKYSRGECSDEVETQSTGRRPVRKRCRPNQEARSRHRRNNPTRVRHTVFLKNLVNPSSSVWTPVTHPLGGGGEGKGVTNNFELNNRWGHGEGLVEEDGALI